MGCFGFFKCLRTRKRNSTKKQEHPNVDVEEKIQSTKVQGQSFTLFKCFRTRKNCKIRKNTKKQEHQNVAVEEILQSPDAKCQSQEVAGQQMAQKPIDEPKKGRLEVLERGSWGDKQQRVSRNDVQLTPRYNQPKAAEELCITIGFRLSPAWKEWSTWEESSFFLPPGQNHRCFQLRYNPEMKMSLPEARRLTSYYQDLLLKRWASDCKKYTFQNTNNSTFSVHGHGLVMESLGTSTNEMVTVNSSVSPTMNWHKLRSILLELRSESDMIYISAHMKPSGSATRKRDLEYPVVPSGSPGCQLNWSEAGSFAGDTEVFRRPAGNQAKVLEIRAGGCHDDLLCLSKACEKGNLSVGGPKIIGIKILQITHAFAGAILKDHFHRVSVGYVTNKMCELKAVVREIPHWTKTKALGNGSGQSYLSKANAYGSQLIPGCRAAFEGTVCLLSLAKAGIFGRVTNLVHWTKAGFSGGTQLFLDHAFVGGFLQDFWNKVSFGNVTKKVLVLKAVIPRWTQTEALGNGSGQSYLSKANAYGSQLIPGSRAAFEGTVCLLRLAKAGTFRGVTNLVHWTKAGFSGGTQLFLDHAFVGGFLQDYWNKVSFGNFTKKVLMTVIPRWTQTEALGNDISQICRFKANAYEGAALLMCGSKAAIASVARLLTLAKDEALGGRTNLVHWTKAGCSGGTQLFQWTIGRLVRRSSSLILEYTFGRQGPKTLFLVLISFLLAFGMLHLFQVIDAT